GPHSGPYGVADSRRLAKKLAGTLRSRNFIIEHDAVLIRVAGEKARIRLVVDGYQMDVFSALLFAELTQTIDTGGEWKWLRIDGDLANHKGHRAYFELLDEGAGWLAVDEIRLTNEPGVPATASSSYANPVPVSFGRGVRGEGRSNASPISCTGTRATEAEKREVTRTRPLTPSPSPQRRGERERVNDVQKLQFSDQTSGVSSLETVAFTPSPPRPLSPSQSELARLTAEADAIAAALPQPIFVHALQDGPACDELLFIRGNHENTAGPVPRRFLEAIAGSDQPTIKARSGRLELADRLLADDNPMPARVMANRIWQHLFGEGLVRSVDNFGVLGEAPSHPELLDDLAISLREDDWSVKRLIRRIVLSRTYQMASIPHPDSASKIAEVDPSNRLLHAQRIRRLEGEALRDAMLAVSGELDPRLGGESVPVHLTEFMQGRGRPKDSGPLDGDGRRSLYIKVQRNFLTPMLSAFDYPPPATTVGRRNVSNVPAQALILLNDPFVIDQAKLWARQVPAEPSLSTEDRITRLYEAAYSRPPSAEETTTAVAFLEARSETDEQAWTDLCHVLFNGKEFVFVR
nr:DUF1553 domain-containing protein [Planctomycetota bacterium]